MNSSHRSPSHLFIIRLLCFLMIFHGPPLLALDVLEIQAEPDFPQLPAQLPDVFALPDRQLPRPGELPTWADVSLWAFPQGGGGGGASTQPPQMPDPESASRKSFDPESVTWGKGALDSIPVVPGWNLLSLPKTPPDASPNAVLASLAGAYAKAWRYDACDAPDPWKLWNPDDPSSDFDAFDTAYGFWLDGTLQADLAVAGDSPASVEIPICPGWNLIGFPAAQARPVPAALSSIDGKWIRVLAYQADNPVPSQWKIHSTTRPDWANELKIMEPGRGYWVLATEAGTLKIANEGPAPEVGISIPQDLAVITEPTQVVGTAWSELLSERRLEYREVGTTDWLEASSSVVPVEDGPLGVFDPTLLINGLYELRVVASDFAGRTSESEPIAVSVEGNMKIGNFTLSFVDLAIPVSGLSIEVVRTYDSRLRLQQGDFGYGWTLDIRQGSYRNNRPPGDGWQITEGFLPCEVPQESKSHVTTVRLSDVEIYRFRLSLFDTVTGGGGCYGRAQFEYVDGPLPGTTLEILGGDQFFWENGTDRLLDTDSLDLFEPENVRLTTRDGRIFDLNLEDGVTALEDLNGNRLTITAEGIQHSSGKGIEFIRDAEGRIEQILDPRQKATIYSYENGDLKTVTDREEGKTTFVYVDDHYLEDIINALGVRAVRTEYDNEGRMIRVFDADNKEIKIDHDLDARREVVTNRLGYTRVLEYDSRGNVIKEIDENQKVTLRQFDDKDRMLYEIDPLERKTTWEYDPATGDLMKIIDPLMRVTEYTYDSAGRVRTIKDPRKFVTENFYDDAGNLRETQDALDHPTEFEYYPDGNLKTIVDAKQHVTTYEYDSYGNLEKVTDAEGGITTSRYDENGSLLEEKRKRTLRDGATEWITTTFEYDDLDRVIKTTAADTGVTIQRYNLLGQVVETIDPLERSTKYEYDNQGRLEKTIYPDLHFERREYDAEGRLKTSWDRIERPTRFDHDPVGRLIKTTFADDAYENNIYDDAGQRIAFIDARRFSTTYRYDNAGQLRTMENHLKEKVTYEYDDNGNITAVTDPRLKTTRHSYDEMNRVYETTYPDTSFVSVEYDELGYRSSLVDRKRSTTLYRYDALGRLVKVIDAHEKESHYEYDELGNLTTFVDANKHETRFEYDSMGRQSKRVLPNGDKEIFFYESDGTLASHIDFNRHTTRYEYDSNRQIKRKVYHDGSYLEFTYTPSGMRETISSAIGTTEFSYDRRDRLSENSSELWRVGYEWDSNGNHIATEIQLANQNDNYRTEYYYDEVNRLVAVEDTNKDPYEYTYYPGGLPATLTFPNQTVTSYDYDENGDLVELSTVHVDGEIIHSWSYERDLAGRLIYAVDHEESEYIWNYNDLDQLKGESLKLADGSVAYQNNFEYDAVGNRKRQDVTIDGTSHVADYSYDSRNRIVGDGYRWDNNGNLTAMEMDGAHTEYRWDWENRLRSVEVVDRGSQTYSYDSAGHRFATTTEFFNQEPSRHVLHVLSVHGQVSQILADIDSDSGAITIYTRGVNGELLGRIDSDGNKIYVHTDHIGSTRAISDHSGDVLSSYKYTSFGQLYPLREPARESAGRHFFAGEKLEKFSGLYDLRARWYMPSTGRFISPDPWWGDIAQPLSRQAYSYVLNSPTNFRDPTGETVGAGVSGYSFGVATNGVLGNVPLGTGVFARSKAWEHKQQRWTPNDEREYERFVSNEHSRYLGRYMDCADLAIAMLIDFSASKGLPVRLQSEGSGVFDSKFAVFGSKKFFSEKARARINAKMIVDFNTYKRGDLPGDVGMARAGDLMMNTRHTRIFLRSSGNDVSYIAGDLYVARAGGSILFSYPKRVTLNTGSIASIAGPNAATKTSMLRFWSNHVLGR